VNGALSVVGSVLTRIMSTSAGFSVVLAVTAGLYLIAGLLFPVPRTNPSVTGLSFPRRSGRSAS
jgi:hypothetical protein